jgi:alkyl hydroperoxide reductase subunit AhpC
MNELKEMDVNIYAVSSDTVENLAALHAELQSPIPYLSDPEFKLIEHLDMRNESVAYRGYALIDKKGEVVFTQINDHWGEQFSQTAEQIQNEYQDMKN